MIRIEGWALLIHNLFKYNFCEHHFDFALYALSFFLSFIAKGLAMCRLGGCD